MTLGQALGCSEEEAERRWRLRQALEMDGSVWAEDFERLAGVMEDQACKCGLNEQPQFAFKRGQAAAYRMIASEIRTMAESNQAVLERID